MTIRTLRRNGGGGTVILSGKGVGKRRKQNSAMMLQTARTTTGIGRLDQLLEGGFPRGRSFLVTGEPGTGKSIFALQFIAEGLKHGERCIFVTADEEPAHVLEKAASV